MKVAGMAGAMTLALCTAAQADTVTREVDYTIDGKAYRGMLVYDDAAKDPRPGILMVPNWLGVTENAARKAAIVAGREYVVLVADVYGADVRPKDPKEAGAVAGALRKDPAELRKRTNAALEVLRTQGGNVKVDPSRMAAVGFCFGGSAVLELARSGTPLNGVVSLHGGLDTPSPAKEGQIRTAVLALNGADDPAVPREQVKAFQDEMRAAKVDWQLVDYGGAVHSFTDPTANVPGRNEYHPVVAKRAYIALHGFLSERFSPAAASH
jgi:dienelactone hydrolase